MPRTRAPRDDHPAVEIFDDAEVQLAFRRSKLGQVRPPDRVQLRGREVALNEIGDDLLSHSRLPMTTYLDAHTPQRGDRTCRPLDRCRRAPRSPDTGRLARGEVTRGLF